MRPLRAARAHRLAGGVAACLVAAGCGLGAGPTPGPSLDPSASPIIETEAEFCAALDVLASEHRVLREIRLRPNRRRDLDDQFEQLTIAWDDLRLVAPRGLRGQLDAVRWAVIDLGIAVEDYATTSRFEEAAEHVLRRDLALDRALDRLRARTTCAPWSATPRPAATPAPSRSPSPSVSPSPVPSASASPPPPPTPPA